MKNKSDKIKAFIEILIIVILFIFFSYIIQKNLETIKLFIDNGMYSMLLYVFIVIIAIVVAPISAIPLLPISSNLWGWFLAAVLSIIGWTIGALIAFEIVKRYGVPLVKKFIPMKKIERIESRVPKQNVFWSVVFLRMVVPVDILSYALGLFSQISRKKYFLATLIGISPFAFVFAYVGRMPIYYQLIALAISILIFVLGLLIGYKILKFR
jgi:uncharacterized membrane protein YdjX (TVP38/TMEM64 family)